ncbi:MAG TPA: YkgJ family cysteine cluster protein [bacterium]|nr:YkgJ family cysteine cluster protein [bacterium]
MAECTPDECNAKCCRYVAIVIDTPVSKADFEDIRWFVAHENTYVYKDEDNDWILEFVTPCKFLKNNRCTMYDRRPVICRDYDPAVCARDKNGEEQKIRFTNPDEVDKFVLKRWPSKKIKGKLKTK